MLSKNDQVISCETSEICKFYGGKNILITGAGGFLGSVLLEILLRCCPDISKIYILLRSKKGMSTEDRKNVIIKKDIFSKLKAANPEVFEKVIPISGDTSQENLGLNEDDYYNITKNVSIVFHVAATISFTKPLGFIIRQNVLATVSMIDLCKKLEKLDVFVYTSSVFSSSNQKTLIEEKIYDLPFSMENILNLARNNDEDEMMRLYHMCPLPFPNFYTFSKCIAENILKEKAGDLPVCIVRPSIILGCLKGPLPGYLEEGSAIVNLSTGIGKGYVRVIHADVNKRIEVIPADVTANAHIVAAFHQVSKRLPAPSVYNCTAGKQAVFTWGGIIEMLRTLVRKHPLPQSYVYPTAVTFKNPMLYNFLSFLLHYVPAVAIDFLLWISGSKLRLLKMCQFFDKVMKSVEFFTMHDWDVENKNFLSLSKDFNALEEEIFCIDLKDFRYDVLIDTFHVGATPYRINGVPYIETFKKKCLRQFLTTLIACILFGSIFYILYFLFFIIF